MKFHRNLTEAVIGALELIFRENKYADKVIEKILKQNPKWGARDRRFIAETTYDIVRWYRLLKEITRAEEHDFWKLIAAYCVMRDIELPPWQEFKGMSAGDIKNRLRVSDGIRKVRQSIPDWLDEAGEKELGSQWDKELPALNEEARVVLRVNTLKTTRESLQQILADSKVETISDDRFPDALILKERRNVFTLPAFKEGLFEVQDAASQLVAPFLEPQPGMRVIDACAGAGGKTLHIASLMKNKGRIIALDVDQWKLDELQKRARRAGISNLETRLIDSSKVIKRLEGTADCLLLDVPCSGLGVLKRNPDAKWKLSPQFVEDVKALQQKIIGDYSIMLKTGGRMVYATCSIFPSENEQQVGNFLASHPDFSLIDDRHACPSEGFDGFYMAALKRK